MRIANIGPGEQRKRLRFGLVVLVVSVLVGGALVALHAPRPMRLFLVLPLWIAALGIVQARDRT